MEAAGRLIFRSLPALLAGPAIGALVGLKGAWRSHEMGKALPPGGTPVLVATGAGVGLAAGSVLLIHELFQSGIARREESGRSARGLKLARLALYVLVYPALLAVSLGVLAILFT